MVYETITCKIVVSMRDCLARCFATSLPFLENHISLKLLPCSSIWGLLWLQCILARFQTASAHVILFRYAMLQSDPKMQKIHHFLTCLLYIPGSSRYVTFLPFGRFFLVIFGTNFTHLEDPGIYIYISLHYFKFQGYKVSPFCSISRQTNCEVPKTSRF